VVEAYLPEGGLKDVNYKNVTGGHPSGFEGIDFGGKYFDGGVILGMAQPEEFYFAEVEFTNDIDSSGVVGTANGQKAFRYEMGNAGVPTGFLSCPFNVWKVQKGLRVEKLNVCFQENPYLSTYDDQWAPDYSTFGGFEILYIMKSDYDASGQLYLGQDVDMKNVLYEVHLKLVSENSVVDTGDKLRFDWDAAATSRDEFTFVPTNVENEFGNELPQSFLYQNYPNPFNPTTTIKFSVAKQSLVILKIYNIMGQEIVELLNKNICSGSHSVKWDGKNEAGQLVSSGLYFAKLVSKGQTRLIKLLLIR